MTALGITAVVLMGIGKVWIFAHAVRQALRPRPLPSAGVDPDSPDDGWRWWEEFGPQPDPRPEPTDRVPVGTS